jgi:hypothetical protein
MPVKFTGEVESVFVVWGCLERTTSRSSTSLSRRATTAATHPCGAAVRTGCARSGR